MATFRLSLLAPLFLMLSGCQLWQGRDIDSLPPTASEPKSSQPGQVNIRYWMDVPGATPDALTALSSYPDTPDDIGVLTSLEQTENRADNYGAMVQGFIIPPQNGLYRFFLSSDDGSELWLGDSQSPEPVTRIATVPGYTPQGVFDKYSSQASAPIELQAGQRYYFRLIFKERAGNDHFSVAWEGPNMAQQVISGESISSWSESIYPAGDEADKAYGIGYRIGFFDGQNQLDFNPQYPPLDEDQDGLYDNWETFYGLAPDNPADAGSDQDGDILTATEEFQLGTSPDTSDTDGDGIPDGAEYAYNLNPLDPRDSAMDSDGDGATNLEEYLAGTDLNDPEDIPSTPPELTSGFVGQYFAGKAFESFVDYRMDDSIKFNWRGSAPIAGAPSDNFSARWHGTFQPPHASGNRDYEFSVRTDDGARLYLDSELVIDEWVDRGPTTNAYTKSVAAGENLQIKLEYYDSKFGAVAQLTITDIATGDELNQPLTIKSPDPESDSSFDSDEDGIPDSWELRHGTDISVADSNTNIGASNDITHLEAFESNLDPRTLEPLTQSEPEAPDTSEPIQDEPASTVSLSWTAPQKRANGDVLDESEISHYKISYGLDESNLDMQTPEIPKNETTYVIEDLEPGIWYFNIRVYDQEGLESLPSNIETIQIN